MKQEQGFIIIIYVYPKVQVYSLIPYGPVVFITLYPGCTAPSVSIKMHLSKRAIFLTQDKDKK